MIDEGTGHLSILLENGMPCNDGKANYSTRFDFFCNDGEPDKVDRFCILTLLYGLKFYKAIYYIDLSIIFSLS